MINGKKINLSFGEQDVFRDVFFNINQDQRIGLVGRNGSGKTTLLEVIGKNQNIDSGQVDVQKGTTIAYMPQQVVLLSKKTILQEAISVFEDLQKLAQELKEIENYLNDHKGNPDPKKVEKYAQLQHELIENEYDKKEVEAKKLLNGLGFSNEQLGQSVETLSVGWKMRLVLAKLLLQKADFYLFDEPTNHLDLVAKDWFLNFLKNSDFGFILVCHEKYLLDHLCTQIYEISMGNLKIYRGNYSNYEKQKEIDNELLEKRYEEQQKIIKREMAVIQRFRAKATKAKMAQSKLRALQKMDIIKLESSAKNLRINLGKVRRSGKISLTVKNLSMFFDSGKQGVKKIFENVSFQIERGQKVAIVAPNGTGKTTLLNVVMQKLKQKSGSFEFGHNIEPVLFEQDQNRSLNLNKTVLQEVEDSCKTTEQRSRVRGFLGAFLFSGDDVEKKIRVLSGGEKNRVAMVKVLLQQGNFLILDEPTNHLDIQSKEILLTVLKQFEGTILFVSHDRDFLNNLATNILDLNSEGVFSYKGNYDSFIAQKNDQENLSKMSELKTKEKKISKVSSFYNSYETRKKIRNLESKIARLEKELERYSKKFHHVEYGTDEYEKIFDKIKKLEKDIASSLALWEEMAE